jgi:hypothetical protein
MVNRIVVLGLDGGNIVLDQEEIVIVLGYSFPRVGGEYCPQATA